MAERLKVTEDGGAPWWVELASRRDDTEPCQCMRIVAYISPTHSGHCCFLPADQKCHPEAFAAWELRAGRTSQASCPTEEKTQ